MLKKNIFSILKDFEFDLKLPNLIAFMNLFRKTRKKVTLLSTVALVKAINDDHDNSSF